VNLYSYKTVNRITDLQCFYTNMTGFIGWCRSHRACSELVKDMFSLS